MSPTTARSLRARASKGALSLIALGLVWLVAGCKTGTAGKVVSVSVNPTGVNIVIGNSQQFNATVLDTFNTAVTWAVAGGTGS